MDWVCWSEITRVSVFDDCTLDDYTDTVTKYMSFCEDISVPVKTVKSYPNSKPWFDNSIRSEIRAKDLAYKSRHADPARYKRAKYELKD